MAKYTPNLNLYEKETTDLDDTFNIVTMLNNNFDLIDSNFGTLMNAHKVFVELTDPTTISGYTVADNDIWFDLTNKKIKYYSSGWQIFI